MKKPAPLLIDLRSSDRAVILSPAGPMTASTADSFREAFHAVLLPSGTARAVVLNLSAVNALDGDGLHLLMAFADHLARTGHPLRIAGLQRNVRHLIEAAEAYKRLDILDTVDEALMDLA